MVNNNKNENIETKKSFFFISTVLHFITYTKNLLIHVAFNYKTKLTSGVNKYLLEIK